VADLSIVPDARYIINYRYGVALGLKRQTTCGLGYCIWTAQLILAAAPPTPSVEAGENWYLPRCTIPNSIEAPSRLYISFIIMQKSSFSRICDRWIIVFQIVQVRVDRQTNQSRQREQLYLYLRGEECDRPQPVGTWFYRVRPRLAAGLYLQQNFCTTASARDMQ